MSSKKHTYTLEYDYAGMIADECDAVKALLVKKNREYGNSAFEPLPVFSDLSAIDKLRVRIDDKLKRIMTVRRLKAGPEVLEDTELDLIGYLVLLRVARKTGAL